MGGRPVRRPALSADALPAAEARGEGADALPAAEAQGEGADALPAAEAQGTSLADRVVRGIGGVLIVVAATEAAVLECFLLPSWIGGVPVPLSIPAAMAGNIGLPILARRVTGSRVAAVLPVLAWLGVAILAAVPRTEGDLIVTGTLRGLVFLLLGAMAGAYGVVRALTEPARVAAGLDQASLVR